VECEEALCIKKHVSLVVNVHKNGNVYIFKKHTKGTGTVFLSNYISYLWKFSLTPLHPFFV
jgi:uncharacterized protein (AIM24 family)